MYSIVLHLISFLTCFQPKINFNGVDLSTQAGPRPLLRVIGWMCPWCMKLSPMFWFSFEILVSDALSRTCHQLNVVNA